MAEAHEHRPTRDLTGKRVPRLVLRFGVFTALGLAVAAAVIISVVRQGETAHAEREAIARSTFVTQTVLSGQLRGTDLTKRVSPTRWRKLDRIFSSVMRPDDMVRATLYGPDGSARYSTAGDLIDPRGTISQPLARALSGSVVSHAGSIGTQRVLSTYVPIVLGSERVRGVVVLDQDYGAIAAAARNLSLVVAGVFEGVLVLLLLIVGPALARASGSIRSHFGELDYVATHDELTGMRNRIGFRLAVEETIARGTPTLGLLLIDLNNFHEINDTVGAESGDLLLLRVAQRLRDASIGCEPVARLGEDEFGLIVPSGGREDILRAGECVREALREPFAVHGVRVSVEASVGAAILPVHGTEMDSVLRCAGVALSTAKSTRQIEIYDSAGDSHHVSQLALTADLRDALSSDQLVVYYQPQADLGTHAVRGVEALVRWQHPQRGLLTAGDFIPLAERCGLITELSLFVLESAAAQWRRWNDLGIALDISVNLAPVDMLDVTLADQLAATLKRYGMPPHNLIIELTERTLLRDDSSTSLTLEQLSRLGVRFAIDDFGTGYSSLVYLRRLSVHQIKLDHGFIAGIPGDHADEAIVRSTVLLAHTLRATVVAEGIERREQWDCAHELGCDIAQGYLVGAPMLPDEIARMFEGPRRLRVAA
jgi:diguanylate cyclase (GGDEF)-like protein